MSANSPPASPSAFACPSCGAESPGPFCTRCGERRLGTDDRSLRHYLDILVNDLTHFDSKGYRSLRYLLTRPGFLSTEQLRGSRVRYAKTLIFLFIPIYAVIFYALFFKRQPFIAAHAIVATHLWSFILVLLAAVVPAIAGIYVAWSDSPTIAAALVAHDNPVSIFVQCAVATYLFVMLRRVYGTGYVYSGVVAVTIAWCFFHLVWLYRFLLFTITLHSL